MDEQHIQAWCRTAMKHNKQCLAPLPGPGHPDPRHSDPLGGAVADRLSFSALPPRSVQPWIGVIAHRDILGLLEGSALSFLDHDFLNLSRATFLKIPTNHVAVIPNC